VIPTPARASAATVRTSRATERDGVTRLAVSVGSDVAVWSAGAQSGGVSSNAAGAQRSGFGSIVGDFLLGQFDRHGLSAAPSLLGPTFSKIDDLAELLHAGGRTNEGMWSGPAMRARAATLLKMVKSNTPFMKLWIAHWVTDALIWHRLKEWISPGYLQHTEQRQKDLQRTHFLIAPSRSTDSSPGGRQAPSSRRQLNQMRDAGRSTSILAGSNSCAITCGSVGTRYRMIARPIRWPTPWKGSSMSTHPR